MSTTSDKLWRCDWTFVILSALAFFLAGVSATLAVCNARSHSSELMTSVRLVQPVLRSAFIASTQVSQVARPSETSAQIKAAPTVRLVSSTSVPAQKPKGTYSAYRVKKGQTLSQLDPEGWQHTCEINKQFGSIKTRDCGLTAEAAILLPANIVSALSLEEQRANTIIPETIRSAEHRVPLNLDDRLRLAEVAREQFCSQQVSNEKLPVCEPEWAARIQMQALALTVGKQSG